MEVDHHDRWFSRLFAELRAADSQEAPPFAALTRPPLRGSDSVTRRLAGRPILVRWAVASALLATATGVVMMKLRFTAPPAPAETGPVATDRWSSPTDFLLGGGTDSLGSLESWRSPTDWLFDFAPTNQDT